MRQFQCGLLMCCMGFGGMATATVCAADPVTGLEMPLWPAGAPDDNGLKGPERAGGCVGNISQATLTVYLPPADKATGAAVVITPGGGYGVVCMTTEGKQIADILVPRGIAAIVVKYRLPNGHHLIPAHDARRAIRTVRQKASDWRINPQKVGVWGFSAGGHLASTVATVFDNGRADADDPIDRQSSRPDFAILFYPVISMEAGVTHGGSRNNLLGRNAAPEWVHKYSNDQHVGPRTPPTFLLHCADDRAVPVENSLRFYRGLIRSGVTAQMLLFEQGGHGPNAFRSNPSWLTAFDRWLKRRKCL